MVDILYYRHHIMYGDLASLPPRRTCATVADYQQLLLSNNKLTNTLHTLHRRREIGRATALRPNDRDVGWCEPNPSQRYYIYFNNTESDGRVC